MITSFAVSTIKYMENYLQVGAVGAIIFIALIVLCVFSLIFLAFRGVRLWYWRVNEQIKALEKIDKSLEEIKQNLPDPDSISICTNESRDQKTQENSSIAEMITEDCMENQNETDAPEIYFDNKEKDERAIIKSGYNIGKTGKVYAEEILREQIQF